MKISQVKTFNVAFKLKKPLKIANMMREKSSNTIVKIETDEGIEGYGEATFAHFFAGETQDSVRRMVDKFLAPTLMGRDPTNILSSADKINRVIAGNPFAKAAVEMALWDIKGKALGGTRLCSAGWFPKEIDPRGPCHQFWHSRRDGRTGIRTYPSGI